ncbi:MAG: glycosyltransferase family A protein [Verrucomicrobiota bacterium]
MTQSHPVTLQIGLSPTDYRMAPLLLRHQLRQWHNQFDEILITLDSHKSSGRFSDNWDHGKDIMVALLDELSQEHPKIIWRWIDYSQETVEAIAQTYFGISHIPAKDHRGGPFYTYFFGLAQATHDWVFHTDADIFFGGGSQTWVKEAIQLMQNDPSIVFSSPLPGPPSLCGELRSQISTPYSNATSLAFRFDGMSTRLFLTQKSRLVDKLTPFALPFPGWKPYLKALIEFNPRAELPEIIVSQSMAKQSALRVDFLGKPPGMWSLHPPYSSETIFKCIPQLIEAIETGSLPQEQLGCHDINDSLLDWSDARQQLARKVWWKRLYNKLIKR